MPIPEFTCPGTLSELFPVFDRLDQGGVSIALIPPPTRQKGARGLEAPADVPPGQLGVTSSGSTGLPKLVWRDWNELKAGTAAVRAQPQAHARSWASPYQPWTFAGVQVALAAWSTSARVVSLSGSWPEIWAILRAERPEAVSATPTFLDLLIQNEPDAATDWHPAQIVLGGEPLRPRTGARLQQRFPETRFTVVYAAAELGVLMRTRRVDGWYDLASLARHWPEWRIVDGTLEVRRRGQWHRTGDQVERRGDAIRVIGRADQVANVAGTKVSLAEVAERAEEVPGVLRAVAIAVSNPVTGHVVGLRYAVDPAHNPVEVRTRLETHLRAQLRKEAWPRQWEQNEIGPDINAKRGLK